MTMRDCSSFELSFCLFVCYSVLNEFYVAFDNLNNYYSIIIKKPKEQKNLNKCYKV